MLATLAPQTTGAQLEQALEATLSYSKEENWKEGLIALAPKLTEKQLERASTATLGLLLGFYRAETLKALAQHLTKKQLERVLEDVLVIQDRWNECGCWKN